MQMCTYIYLQDKKALHDLCLFRYSDEKGNRLSKALR